MPPEPRPHLAAVTPDDPAPPPSAPSPAGSRSGALWLLLVLLIATGIGLLFQTRRAGELEDRVATLGTELSEAQGRLSGFESHLAEVRERISGLRSDLEALDAMAAEDPSREASSSR